MSFPPVKPLHRSWLLQGTMNPPPYLASMSGLLEETSVEFLRSTKARTRGGGFDATADPVVYLTAMCHVEIHTDKTAVVAPAVGFIYQRHWWLSMAIPDALAKVPARGDRVRFTNPLGVVEEHVLVTADTPEGIADHLEMTTESWQ